jgi:hypothetical protein
VVVPARMVDAFGQVRPDPTQSYPGSVAMPGIDVAPVAFGDAIVVGGHKSGNQWPTCPYTRAPFLVPGVGRIEEV